MLATVRKPRSIRNSEFKLSFLLGKPRSNPFPHVAGAGYNHWNRVYSYDMRTNLTQQEADLIIGGECAMWGEKTDETNFEGKIWPRVRLRIR